MTNATVILVVENTDVNVNVECSAGGYPQPTIRWKIGENILAPANGSVASALWSYDADDNGFKGSYRVLSNGTLNIRGYYTKAPASQDHFLCIAKNTIKKLRQNYTFIFVKCKCGICRIFVAMHLYYELAVRPAD